MKNLKLILIIISMSLFSNSAFANNASLEILPYYSPCDWNGIDNIFKQNVLFMTDDGDLYDQDDFDDMCGDELCTAVLRVNGVAVGFVSYCIDEDNIRSGRIAYLGVLKRFHRKGMGAFLLNHGVEALKGMGCTKIDLCVDKKNTGAIRLYEKHDFSNNTSVVDEKYYIYEHKVDIFKNVQA